MKNLFKKAVKLTTVATLLSSIILGTIYVHETQVDAKSLAITVKPVVVVEETATETEATVVETTTEAIVTEETTVEETTVEETTTAVEVIETEAVETIEETQPVTEEVTTEAVTEAVTEEETSEEVTEAETTTEEVTTVEETTPAPTEPATEAPVETQPEVEAETLAAAPAVTYTDVTFKDGYNTYKFATLEEAMASLNIATLSNEEANARANANKSTYSSQAARVLELINEYRTANGLAAVAYDDTIATAAMHRAAESAYANWNMTAYENGTTKRHIRPNFQKASTILENYGLSGSFGENYGRYQASPEEILDGWKNSSSHNALMLGGSYTKCGIGVAQDSEGYFYWIAIFM